MSGLAELDSLHLPMSRAPRWRTITTELVSNPADPRTLAQWSRTAGASLRTLVRPFQAETGLSFTRCRQQACLLRALALLASGAS